MEGYDDQQENLSRSFERRSLAQGRRPAGLSGEQELTFLPPPPPPDTTGPMAGGLCDHSLNVYHCLVDYLARERVQELYGLEYSEESVAVVALLHDLCKVGCYKKSFREREERCHWTVGAGTHLYF